LRFHLRRREKTQGGGGEICESLRGTFAVTSVAIMIAVEEPRSDFPKIGCPDRLTAQHTRGLFGGPLVIHQYEFHVASPSATRNAASDECEDIWWWSAEVISAVGSFLFDSDLSGRIGNVISVSIGLVSVALNLLAGILDTLSPAFGFSE
jgi:hypothetical protein